MTKDRARQIMQWLAAYKKLRTDWSEEEWVALKLSCSSLKAEQLIRQARKMSAKEEAK